MFTGHTYLCKALQHIYLPAAALLLGGNNSVALARCRALPYIKLECEGDTLDLSHSTRPYDCRHCGSGREGIVPCCYLVLDFGLVRFVAQDTT